MEFKTFTWVPQFWLSPIGGDRRESPVTTLTYINERGVCGPGKVSFINIKSQFTLQMFRHIFFSKCDVEAGLSIQSLSVFPSSYHTILDKGRYPIYLLVSGQL